MKAVFGDRYTMALLVFFLIYASLPISYIRMSILADALDHLEWKNGFRLDGLVMSIYSIITTALVGLCTGIFNGAISKSGYIALFSATADTLQQTLTKINQMGYQLQVAVEKLPVTTDGVYTLAVMQPAAVNQVITFCFVGLEVITGLMCAGILLLTNPERNLERKQKIIFERQRQLALAEGREWMNPAVRAEMEQRELDEKAEKAYEEELRERCSKNGKDYEKMLREHLEQKARAQEKNREKKEKEEKKEALSQQKQERKKAEKMAALNPKQKDKMRKKAEKEEQLWEKERKAGEESYRNMQALLRKEES